MNTLKKRLFRIRKFLLTIFLLSNSIIWGNSLLASDDSEDISSGLSELIVSIAQNFLPTPEVEIILPDSLTLSISSSEVYIGTSRRITPVILPAQTTNKTISWHTNNPQVLEVTSGGIVVARDFGTATITATMNVLPSIQASIDITVIDYPEVVNFNPQLLVNETSVQTLDRGINGRINIEEVVPSNAKITGVSYVSLTPTLATVNQDGIVRAINVGEATIEITLGLIKKELSFSILEPSYVIIEPDSFQIYVDNQPNDITGYVERTIQLNVDFGNIVPTDEQVYFQSLSPHIARVNQQGIVTGINYSGYQDRQVIIRAYPYANPSLVIDQPITIKKVFPTQVLLSTSTSIQAGRSAAIQPTFTPVDTTDRQLIWSSSNPEIATVSSGGDVGVITPLKEGSVIITARSVMDESVFQTLEINILPPPLLTPDQWTQLYIFVRKGIGHFALNFINGFLGFLTFYAYFTDKKLQYFWLSISVGIVLSTVAEGLQFFAPGRSPTWTDVVYNNTGYLSASLMMLGFIWFLNWNKKISDETKKHKKNLL
jgi:uncharacterized protein YjdB/VanZ family protein